MSAQLRPALVVFGILSVITGVLYPLAMTGLAQALFHDRANGSIIQRAGKDVGSSLLGQDFASSGDPGFFWGRPSATGPVPYTSFNADKATGSSGSNVGPTNPALVDAVSARIKALAEADAAAGYRRPAGERVPVDLVTSSGSGLDPHISPAAAEYQLPRVAKARGLSESALREVVLAHTQGRQFGLLGEPVVNVLELNLAVEKAAR